MAARQHGVSHGNEHWLRPASYKKWMSMRYRVRHPRGRKEACYIGVTIDPRWDDYENFLADMGEPPPGMTIDRIDNSKGYGPDNCRWANMHTQILNRAIAIPLIGRAYARGMRGRMTQADIAAVIGCTQAAVSHIQLGRHGY